MAHFSFCQQQTNNNLAPSNKLLLAPGVLGATFSDPHCYWFANNFFSLRVIIRRHLLLCIIKLQLLFG